MEGYLGEFDIDIRDTPYKDFTPKDWCLTYIRNYGDIDGAHHKDWVLDQVVRILTGTEVIITEVRWKTDDGYVSELRFNLEDEPTDEYHQFVKDYEFGKNGSKTYKYDVGLEYDAGIAP